MEQYKLIIEIQELRKEIKELKGGQNEGSAIAVMSLFLGFGLGFFLYSINLLNEAINATIEVWTAILCAITGLLIMMFSGFIATRIKRNGR